MRTAADGSRAAPATGTLGGPWPALRRSSAASTRPPRAYLSALRERVVIFDGATGTNLQLAEPRAPTTSAAPSSKAATRSWSRPGPTSSNGCTDRSSTWASTSSRPTPSAASRSCSPSTASPTAPRSSTARRRRSPGGWPTTTRARTVWVAGSMGPGTKFPTLGQISFADLRDSYEVQARGLLEGGVDLLARRDRLRPLERQGRHQRGRRAMAECGRQVPLQVQVTIELTGRMLPGHRDRRRAHRARRHAGRRDRPQLRHRPGRDGRGARATSRPTARSRSRACPTPGSRAWSTARCTTTSPPSSSPTTTTAS